MSNPPQSRYEREFQEWWDGFRGNTEPGSYSFALAAWNEAHRRLAPDADPTITKARFLGSASGQWWYPGRRDLYMSRVNLERHADQFEWKDDPAPLEHGGTGMLWPWIVGGKAMLYHEPDAPQSESRSPQSVPDGMWYFTFYCEDRASVERMRVIADAPRQFTCGVTGIAKKEKANG